MSGAPPEPAPAAGSAAAAGASAAAPQGEEAVIQRLRTLKTLHDQGLIPDHEFEARRTQLVNQLTGTTNPQAPVPRKRRGHSLEANLPPIVAKPPPTDFGEVRSERALLHSFDPRSNHWSKHEVTIRMEESPFARGALRLCYYCAVEADVDDRGGTPSSQTGASPRPGSAALPAKKRASTTLAGHPLQQLTGSPCSPGSPGPPFSPATAAAMASVPHTPTTVYVAKLSIDPNEERQTYFIDVQIQMYARMFAERFNAYNPPKKVDFLKAWILELTERKGTPLCGLERFIDGPYRKHNNNFGYVSDLERNTPQAFSHFTYEASGHVLLVCDIQGVDDVYTDPQVHTVEDSPITEQLLGKGNMGPLGFQQFLSGHKCNAICQYLRLPPVNAKSDLEDLGTMPAQRYMSAHKVGVVDVVGQQQQQGSSVSIPQHVAAAPPPSPPGSPSARLLPPSMDSKEPSCCPCLIL
eukprot:m51a1_g9785 putative myosin heavy chain (466) ;mRNA; r:1695421-1698611